MGRVISITATPLAGFRMPVGRGYSTVLPDMDFETYSEAGYYFDEEANRWRSIVSSPPHGLGAVGASVYTEHPSAEVLCLSYDFKDGVGARLWIPGMEAPWALFDHFARGGIMEAWNSSFEWYVWNNICHKRMGWPALNYLSLRCAMSKNRAFSRPGALKSAGEVAGVQDMKIADGARLITKFCKPHKPTKKDPRRRIRPEEDPEGWKLYEYCIGDIKTESQVSELTPDLSPMELELWQLDQAINFRGVYIDPAALEACVSIVEQATVKYTAELVQITGGTVKTASELQKMKGWLGGRGLFVSSLDMEHVEEELKKSHLPPDVRRVLEIRQTLGSASVKKVFAILRRLSADGRLRDLFAFHKAHTGRFAGQGPQPQNLPKSGPKIYRCGGKDCRRFYTVQRPRCPWCGADGAYFSNAAEWGLGAAEDALAVIATRDLATVEHYFGDSIDAVSGCLRGLFSAAPGHELICSDYSAIEAVVLACVAGEQWRIDVFNTHGKIYEASASMITGIPLQEFMDYKKRTGDHHPMRNKIGKYAELASGYQGWLGAWKNFGADKHLSDDEIKDAVRKWRDASPAIVALWAGLEGAATSAVQSPGDCFQYRGIAYGVCDDVLYCQLPSGRCLSYHEPRILPKEKIVYDDGEKFLNNETLQEMFSFGKIRALEEIAIPVVNGEQYAASFDNITISMQNGSLRLTTPNGVLAFAGARVQTDWNLTYMGENSDYKRGPKGWMRLETYGGKLAENVVQGAACDVLTFGMMNLEKAGYPIVLHVHDEDVSEVPIGFGSIEEYEAIMSTMPPWAQGWPIKASGGWRGQRYRKD